MTAFMKLLAGAAGLAAIGAAAPASAQYNSYGYTANPYGYTANPYGYAANPYASTQYGYAANPYASTQYGYTASPYAANPYGYSAYGANTARATQQCTAAVQSRLHNRTSLGSILGSLVGVPQSSGRVLSVTSVTPRSSMVRVRGFASSGRMASNGYGPYGVGAYGGLGYGYNQMADLSFKCDVDYRGYVRDLDINRR